MRALYLIPQWIFICISRLIRLYISSLSVFPFKFSSIFRFVLVSTLTVLALLVSLFHIVIVSFEQIVIAPFRNKKSLRAVFIIGAPRSGTTRMHKLMLGEKETFTSMKLWEMFFAPARSQKLVLKSLGRIDDLFGSPLMKMIIWIEKKMYGKFNSIHSLSLFSVEEDALILYHLFSCYHLSFLLGNEKDYKRMNCGEKLPKAIWEYYKICIENHLAFESREKIYLSKNPFFSASIPELRSVFPQSQFVYMKRKEEEMIGSFLSLKRFLHLTFYGVAPSAQKYQEVYGYLKLWNTQAPNHQNKPYFKELEYTDLVNNPTDSVLSVMSFLELDASPAYHSHLNKQENISRNYVSKHNYKLSDFGLE